MDNRTDYYLLLADLKGSSGFSAEHGNSVIERLLPELEWQNQRVGGDLAYPFEVNYGDEFAALFLTPRMINQVISDIRDMLRPVAQFRFVVVRGRIGYAGGTLREMGGPVFQKAARALKRLKKARQYSDWQISDSATDLALTAMSNAAASLVFEMTDYQHAVFLLQKAGLSGKEIAEKLSKNPRSVSNAKKTSHSKTVLQIESAMSAMLALVSDEPSEPPQSVAFPVDTSAQTQEVA
ncbi:MAG: SatD family protein [Henriciella sp.]